ncbi:MAG: hypothetical protein BWY66_02695 [bacterium ADurb.Bin374]|nr:MAG: hypothetical protein BWY66_02695 [bacterium ADurb.Bin374]
MSQPVEVFASSNVADPFTTVTEAMSVKSSVKIALSRRSDRLLRNAVTTLLSTTYTFGSSFRWT